MTYRECIYRLDRIRMQYDLNGEEYSAVVFAQKALEKMPEYDELKEKDTPKEPIRSYEEFNGSSFEKCKRCPNCGEELELEEEYGVKRCGECGQYIMWPCLCCDKKE